MADTQIDELRLDITVEDKTSGESSDKKVKNLATAISRLNKNLQAFDNAKFTKVFDNMSKGLDPFVKKIEKVSNALASLATIVSKGGLDKAVKETTGQLAPMQKETVSSDNGKSEPIQAIQGQAEEIKETTNNAKSLGSSILDISNKADILRKKLEMVNAEMQKSGLSEKQLVQLKSQQLSIQEQIAKAEGKKPKVPLSNLLKSFGRIAMYRAIRTVIKEITQAFTEGIGGLARYNREVNQSMSKITSNFAQVKASISIALYQPLIAIEPIITAVSQSIVHLSNGLSFLFAKLRGASTYMKINTQYLKDYKSALDGTLLSFDTFETLGKGKGIDYSQMFEEVSVDEGLNKSASIMLTILGGILATITAIGVSKLITWISSGGAKKAILSITDSLNTTTGKIATLTLGFTLLAAGIMDMAKSWNDANIGNWEKAIIIITAAMAGLAVAILAVRAAMNPFAALGYAAAVAGATLLLGTELAKTTKPFADGGMMTHNTFSGAGTMYAIAGESGAEVVAQGSAGTGVLNVDQFADAMVSALVRYGAARDNGSGTTIVLDGNKVGQLVASNAGFRNEANRRNAGLNWK